MRMDEATFPADPRHEVGNVRIAGPSAARVSMAWAISRVLMVTSLRLLFRWRVEGRENLPSGGYLVIANHLNWLDVFALVLALPCRPKVYLLGWSAVMDSRKLSWLIRNTDIGFIPVDRDGARRSRSRHALLRRMLHCVGDGGVICLFPEGSVGETEGRLMDLHPGFAKLALAGGAAVVPVALSGTRDLWLGKKIRVRIGAPIPIEGHDVGSLAEAGHAALERLLPEYREPAGPKLWRRRLTRLIPSLTNTQAD